MRSILIIFILLFDKPSDAFLTKFVKELAQIPTSLPPTVECTLHYHQIGDFEGGLALLGDIHSRLETSPVSWLVYTEWPISLEEDSFYAIWEAAKVMKRHQSWCSIIFFFFLSRETFEEEFYQSFYDQIYRTERILILIRDTLGKVYLRDYLYVAPGVVSCVYRIPQNRAALLCGKRQEWRSSTFNATRFFHHVSSCKISQS